MNFDFLDKFPSSRKFPFNIFSWIGRHELSVLIAVMVIIGGAWLTVELADGVAEGSTQELDLQILMLLREGEEADNPIGPPWVEELMRDLTALAGTGILVLIVGSVTVYYLLQGRYKQMTFLLVAVLGAFIISSFFKDIFDRPRPEFIPEGAYAYSASFPSGHALLAATTYLTLGIVLAQILPRARLKAFTLLLSIFIMILVGFTRMYLGVHWPTDVLAGWTIGAVWALVCWLAFRWFRRRGAIEPD